MSIRVKAIHATVPAVGWYAKFEDQNDRVLAGRVPVESWVYADYQCSAVNKETNEVEWDDAQGWLGMGIWTDGPEFMESFSDFSGYDRWNR